MPTLLFDCDGVLADTERYGHLPAFNATFEEVGLPTRWDEEEYGRRLTIGGGKERMASLFRDPGFTDAAGIPDDEDARTALLASWHRIKTGHFTRLVTEGLIPPRPGVRRVIVEALDAGWSVGVASTSALESVTAVLVNAVGEDVAARIPVFAGDAVKAKKPDPAIYLLALETMGADPSQTLVVEDSRNGLRAAVGAGLPCVVTVNGYTRGEDFSEASLVVSDLGDPGESAVEVLANPAGAEVWHHVGLEALASCLGAGRARLAPSAG